MENIWRSLGKGMVRADWLFWKVQSPAAMWAGDLRGGGRLEAGSSFLTLKLGLTLQSSTFSFLTSLRWLKPSWVRASTDRPSGTFRRWSQQCPVVEMLSCTSLFCFLIGEYLFWKYSWTLGRVLRKWNWWNRAIYILTWLHCTVFLCSSSFIIEKNVKHLSPRMRWIKEVMSKRGNQTEV